MANTQLNHKVRNPKDLSKWLTIWSADITNGTTYTITPSNNWSVPVSLIDWTTEGSDTTTLPSNIQVPVDRLIPLENTEESNLPANIKISFENLSNNALPIMTKNIAGIAKAGNGLILDNVDTKKLNIKIDKNNVDTTIDNFTIPRNKLDSNIIARRLNPTDYVDPLTQDEINYETATAIFIGKNSVGMEELTSDLQDTINSLSADIPDNSITVNKFNTHLLGVGIGPFNSPEESNILSNIEKEKCGIWIQI